MSNVIAAAEPHIATIEAIVFLIMSVLLMQLCKLSRYSRDSKTEHDLSTAYDTQCCQKERACFQEAQSCMPICQASAPMSWRKQHNSNQQPTPHDTRHRFCHLGKGTQSECTNPFSSCCGARRACSSIFLEACIAVASSLSCIFGPRHHFPDGYVIELMLVP